MNVGFNFRVVKELLFECEEVEEAETEGRGSNESPLLLFACTLSFVYSCKFCYDSELNIATWNFQNRAVAKLICSFTFAPEIHYRLFKLTLTFSQV